MTRRLVLFAAVVFGSGACKRAPSVEQVSRDLASEWAAEAAQDRPRPSQSLSSSGGPASIVLYVDASRSMAGFAGCNEQPTEYNTVLDRLTSVLSITSVVRFGERSRGGGNAFEMLPLTRAVHCAPFYDRLQNPDYELYRLAKEKLDTVTSVYVTDGVQSDWQGTNPGRSLGLLREWVEQDRGLAILAFRSRFAGPAWSEQRQQMLGEIRAEARPFYIFLLAQSDSAIGGMLRQLSPAMLQEATTIRFRHDAVRCSADAAGQLQKWARTTNPPWAMVKHEHLQSAPGLFRFECALAPEYPLQEVAARVASVWYSQWRQGSFDGRQSAPPGAIMEADSVTSSVGTSLVQIGGVLPFDPAARYGFYGLRFEPEPGALKPHVAELSTDSDAQPDSFEKTYRFSWLVEHLVRAHLERQPWTPYALTIQYR